MSIMAVVAWFLNNEVPGPSGSVGDWASRESCRTVPDVPRVCRVVPQPASTGQAAHRHRLRIGRHLKTHPQNQGLFRAFKGRDVIKSYLDLLRATSGY